MSIVFLSVINIALGYGLAIYFGRARAPWFPEKRATNNRPSASGRKESRNDSTETLSQENGENSEEAAAEAIAETVDETSAVSAEKAVLDSVETIQKEIHEQSEPTTVHEASATEAGSSIPDSQDEQETAESATVTDDELMQGIGAFQEQLKKQQEPAKLHAVGDTSEDKR